jgi:hypothetical protein
MLLVGECAAGRETRKRGEERAGCDSGLEAALPRSRGDANASQMTSFFAFCREPNTGSRRGVAQRLNAAQWRAQPATGWGQQPASAAGRRHTESAIVMTYQGTAKGMAT